MVATVVTVGVFWVYGVLGSVVGLRGLRVFLDEVLLHKYLSVQRGLTLIGV